MATPGEDTLTKVSTDGMFSQPAHIAHESVLTHHSGDGFRAVILQRTSVRKADALNILLAYYFENPL